MLLRAYAETLSEKVRQSAAELRTKFVVSQYKAFMMSIKVVLLPKTQIGLMFSSY